MLARVITIYGHEGSEAAATRCIESGKEHGIAVSKFRAITPENKPVEMFEELKFDPQKFIIHNKYSYTEPAMSAFLSHYMNWWFAMAYQQPMLIMEHDAVIEGPLPEKMKGHIVNLGHPSFGRFRTPEFKGEGPLTSKKFMPGAHGYYITPEGGAMLVHKAQQSAQHADVFISLSNFPDITEVYPWPIKCDDSFSTIQKPAGCKAKHNDVKPA